MLVLGFKFCRMSWLQSTGASAPSLFLHRDSALRSWCWSAGICIGFTRSFFTLFFTTSGAPALWYCSSYRRNWGPKCRSDRNINIVVTISMQTIVAANCCEMLHILFLSPHASSAIRTVAFLAGVGSQVWMAPFFPRSPHQEVGSIVPPRSCNSS